MQYWLLKTEPEEWSWHQQVESGMKGAEWNGVRNFQAAKNLKTMKVGDKCFFYHSGKIKCIMGVAEVIKGAFLDKSDNNFKKKDGKNSRKKFHFKKHSRRERNRSS